MPVSSILKAAGKPASPSHSVETHTLSLHIRHTENDLSQTQKETIPERQVQPRLHSDLLRPSLFLYTSRPGFPGKGAVHLLFDNQDFCTAQYDTCPGKGGRVADYYSPSSSSFFLRVVLRFFGFSSAGLSTFTPASSGSIRIRPQYSQTMIFLCIFTSS